MKLREIVQNGFKNWIFLLILTVFYPKTNILVRHFRHSNDSPTHIRENTDFPRQIPRQLPSAMANFEGWTDFKELHKITKKLITEIQTLQWIWQKFIQTDREGLMFQFTDGLSFFIRRLSLTSKMYLFLWHKTIKPSKNGIVAI